VLWRELGILHHLTLELNTLGSSEARAEYRQALTGYLEGFYNELDEDSQRRLTTNPLRILDSKSATTQKILENAPSFDDYLDNESRQHFAGLCQFLDAAGVAYKLNPLLVRGLDYYSKTVFEWTTTALGSQGTVCAGGRYDALVKQLGGKATPAVGFAMGVERLILLLETLEAFPEKTNRQLDIYLAASGEGADAYALLLAERLRSEEPSLRILTHCGGGGFKQQIKRADRSGAELAILLGENEMSQGIASVKYLREDKEQSEVTLSDLAGFLHQYLQSC